MRTSQRPEPLRRHLLLIGILCCLPSSSLAGDIRLSVALGYGGAGVVALTTVNGVSTSVSRSEAPIVFSLGLDILLTDKIDIGIEQSRGVGLGPASSGVSFTGGLVRWFFRSPAMSVAKQAPDSTAILVKSFSPFVGLSAGLAYADVTRTGDVVPQLTGSGVYVGGRLGAEYPIKAGLGIRPEINYMTSLSGPASLTEFSVQCGVFIFL